MQYDSPFLPTKSELGRSSTFQPGNTRQKKRSHDECLSCDRPCVCPQDIVAGDMSKKSLWEQKGGSKISSTIKSTPSGKRYKFVATGHGKYEKVLVDEGSAP